MRHLTLLFSLFLLAAPALAQQLSPAPNETVSRSRPTISATFYQDVGPARIWIDGTEFTSYASHRGRTVTLNPPYNLDFGTHRVQVRTNFGGTADWTFNIAQPTSVNVTGRVPGQTYPSTYPGWNQGGAGSAVLQYGPTPGSTVTVTRPPVGAVFTGQVRNMQMTVDGVDVTRASSIQNNRITWNPGYDLDQGQHNCIVTGTAPNGQQVRGEWTFVIRSI